MNKINVKARKLGITPRGSDSAIAGFRCRLHRMIEGAIADSGRSPRRVIARLCRLFEQRVWWQISEPTERAAIRSTMGTLLAGALRRIGDTAEAAAAQRLVEFETRTFASSAGSSSAPVGR